MDKYGKILLEVCAARLGAEDVLGALRSGLMAREDLDKMGFKEGSMPPADVAKDVQDANDREKEKKGFVAGLGVIKRKS